MSERSGAEYAVEIQQKYNFYVLGLTFGILALSVQTAADQGATVAILAELLAWLLLLASGLIGLWRMEWEPKAHQLGSLQNELEIRTHSLQKARLSGVSTIHIMQEKRDAPVEELIRVAESDVTTVKNRLVALDRIAIVKYRCQKVTFVLGIFGLIIARGYQPFVRLFP